MGLKGRCYVCGYTRNSVDAKGLHFHMIPSMRVMQEIANQWLAFLHLPPTTFWPQDSWKEISLCSRHFDEGVYNSQSGLMVRVTLKKGATPTLKRPSGPGVLGTLFSPSQSSQLSNDDPSSSPIADSSVSETTEKNDTSDGHLKTQHFCKDNEEDVIIKEHPLENLRKELCRLCGQRGSVLKPIFEPTSDMSKDVPLSSKIDMYLPIKVKLGDSLPVCICSNCLLVLNQWHELYTTCVSADAFLSETFGKESHELSVNNTSTSVVQRNAETQTEERPLGVSMDLFPSYSVMDEMRRNENIFTHCEEAKTGFLLEDNLFTGQLNKNIYVIRKTLFKCNFCSEVFRKSSDRKSHTAICRELSTICELCGHKVPCRKNLGKHKYTKHNAAPRKYLCDKCHKFFKTTTGLKIHLEGVHGAKDSSEKHWCELCGAVFKQKQYFHLHQKDHESGKVKAVFQIENFRQEVNSEGSENGVVYVCPVCQENFNEASSLAVHLAEKKKLKCPLCPKVLISEKKLFLHVCRQWTCQYCLKSFDHRAKWLVHERWHTGEKPIKCRKCDQCFRTWHSRRYHEAKHGPSLQCIYCGKSFTKKRVFQDHVSCHEGKEFSCHVCNKKFSGRHGLSRHVNVFHKGTRPSFQCVYCGKSFRDKRVFKDHVSRHEGKEFSCCVCNKKFSGRDGLSRHLNAFHKGLKKSV